MNDSSERDALEAKHARVREQRIRAIERWVEYIRNTSPDEWGDQQNTLVDSQLESARETALDVEHYRRIERAVRDR